MSAKVRVERQARSGAISGPSHLVVPALKLAHAPRQWDSRRRCWLVPNAHLDDVLAALEYRVGGVTIELVDAAAQR